MKFTSHIYMPLLRKGSNKPDYQNIKKNVLDKESKFYYPSLVKKYYDINNNFILEELQHLYYGYVFNKKYNPYNHPDVELALDKILKKPTHNKNDIERIIEFSIVIMKYNPFDYNALSSLMYAYRENDDKQNHKLVQRQLANIWVTIINSGDGTKPESAFHVLYVSHEYLLLDLFDLKYGGKQQLIGDCDYLTTIDKVSDIKGVYFNIKAALNHSK